MLVALSGCGSKKKSDNIITKPVVKAEPKAPERMQVYDDVRDVGWIGRKYHVAIHRQPCDSVAVVKDETGQGYVDNVITVSVSREDGSVFFSRTFAKADFREMLDADYVKTGILEGLVFDKAEGDYLFFAASVSHPHTDEYIPMVVRLSRMGDVNITRDTQMDTSSASDTDSQDDDF
jgi:hypothetical protein